MSCGKDMGGCQEVRSSENVLYKPGVQMRTRLAPITNDLPLQWTIENVSGREDLTISNGPHP